MPHSNGGHSTRSTASVATLDNREPISLVEARGKNAKYDTVKQNRQNETEGNQLTLYPAFCYKISPTWFTWAKLTVWQIHSSLRYHKDFHAPLGYESFDYGQHAPLLLFYLNHPIQFVQVVGVVVNFEDYFEGFWMLTVDDSSGATIDLTCPKLEDKKAQIHCQNAVDGTAPRPSLKSRKDDGGDESIRLNILLSSAQISIGTVVQAKGTITTFRQIRQIRLHRLRVVHSTAAEVSLIAARTTFQTTVLNEAWYVDSATLEKLKKSARGEAEEDDKKRHRRKLRAKQKLLREKRHATDILKSYQEEEKQREYEAEKAKQAAEVWQRSKSISVHDASTLNQARSAEEIEDACDERTMLLRETFGK